MYGFSLLAVVLATSTLASAAMVPRAIQSDEMIAFGENGREEIVKVADFMAEMEKANITLGRPDSVFDHPDQLAALNTVYELDDGNATHLERRCAGNRLWVNRKNFEFVDWDVPMSSAVYGAGTTNTITVTSGFQVSDAIAVSVGVDYTFIKDRLSASAGITYTKTWTSSFSAAYTQNIPKGKWGMMVSNPIVRRDTGTLRTGCPNRQRTTTYQADRHFSQSRDGLSWVQGGIRLCIGNTYPIPRCLGGGTLR